MAEIWSEQRKVANWLEIELLAVEARVQKGEVPLEDLKELQTKAGFDIERIKDIEKKTRHDVAAFLDNVAEMVGPAARHLHYGMTSSDVLDTGLSLQMVEAARLLAGGIKALIAVTTAKAREHERTVMAGRTHGIHAEPTTLGLKIAGWAFELDRARLRIQEAQREVAVGKLSGAVGNYSQLDPEVERFVCDKLGLAPDPSSSQVISRDRHAAFAAALGIAAGTIERIATEIRHLARTELGEAEEPFAAGEQKGSSAMPHKRNPWRCERLTGLARVVRAGVVPAIENIALWHERDISHSSVERVMLPDACILLDFMLAEAAELVEGMVVYPGRMRENMDASYGVLFSQNILLALVDAGLSRDEAYRLVQEASMEAFASRKHLRDLLKERPEVTRHLDAASIEACFDESRYLRHCGQIIERLNKLDVS